MTRIREVWPRALLSNGSCAAPDTPRLITQAGNVETTRRRWSLTAALRALLAATLVTAGLTPAFAQEKVASASDDEAPVLQEVIVTGSRIAAPNAVSTRPIQVLTADYVEQSGKTDIGDVLLQLPQVLTNSVGQDLGN